MSESVAPKFLLLSGDALAGYAAAMAESAEMIRAFPDAATAVAMMLEREGLVASSLASRHQEALATDERDMAGLADVVAEEIATGVIQPPTKQACQALHEPADMGEPTPLYTAARIALLRRLVPTVMPMTEVLERVNALPAAGLISSVDSLRVKCRAMGIHRRDVPIPAELVPPPALPDQRKWDPADGIPEEEFPEALQLVDNGWHGRQIAEWFGWSLDVAAAFTTKYRKPDRANG